MPATIVIVHDDPEFAEPALATLHAAGYDVVAFSDFMSGIDALEHPKRIELLITRVRFPAGTPNGAALARMAGSSALASRCFSHHFPKSVSTLRVSVSSYRYEYRLTNCWRRSAGCWIGMIS